MHPEKNSDEPIHLQSLTRLANAWENVGHFHLAEHTAKTGQTGRMSIQMLLIVGFLSHIWLVSMKQIKPFVCKHVLLSKLTEDGIFEIKYL